MRGSSIASVLRRSLETIPPIDGFLARLRFRLFRRDIAVAFGNFTRPAAHVGGSIDV